jgi:hypothetical protein
MQLSTIILLLSAIILSSCDNSSDPQNQHTVPYGTWIYSGTEDNLRVYYSADEFETDNAGISLRPNQLYIERTSGWCGTPPLTFSNTEGQWELFDENTLKITCPNWIDEDYSRIMEIVYLSDTELKVIFHSYPD